jgi:hypothetical protein
VVDIQLRSFAWEDGESSWSLPQNSAFSPHW